MPISAASPVPPELTDVDDATYEDYIDERGDVVVMVFKRNCAPCNELKANLSAIVAGAPDHVSFAGVNGEDVTTFRRDFEVSVAPTTLVFSGGDLVERFEGGTSAETLLETFEAVFGSETPE